jgi:toxin-antitoxin system PIN domain toxin
VLSIDTNLLLYGLNSGCPEHDASLAFLRECSARSDVAIAELVLVELYVLLRNPAVIREPLGAAEAAAMCRPFRTHPRWALIDCAPVMARVWEEASREDAARRHVFDARLALTLLHHGVRELATRNVSDFERFPFERVFDPLARSA